MTPNVIFGAMLVLPRWRFHPPTHDQVLAPRVRAPAPTAALTRMPRRVSAATAVPPCHPSARPARPGLLPGSVSVRAAARRSQGHHYRTPAPTALPNASCMTVMFCDLVGSSKLASRLDPEEFATLLVAYRERCAAAVAQRGGYVSRYVGDGVLACFGYPRAIGRDAQAAVSCGLAIAKEIRALADTTSLPGGQELAVRIGIDTGVVLAGRLGPDNAMELDALVGTAPHMAARLQSLASPNTVVIGEGTHEAGWLKTSSARSCRRSTPSSPMLRPGPFSSAARRRGGQIA